MPKAKRIRLDQPIQTVFYCKTVGLFKMLYDCNSTERFKWSVLECTISDNVIIKYNALSWLQTSETNKITNFLDIYDIFVR